MAPVLVGSAAAARRRQRKFFFLHVSNVLGTYNLSVGYRSTKGVIQPLSASPQSASMKVPFGPIHKCQISEKVGSIEESLEQHLHFKFFNKKNQTMTIKDTPLNNLEVSLDDFSRKITELMVDKKFKLLALYLSIINFSADFVFHKGEKFDENGLGSYEVQELVDAGGSLEELKQFIDFAKESALMVESEEKAIQEISDVNVSKKRKSRNSLGPSKPSKLSKPEVVVKHEKEEIEDKGGIEEEYKNSLVGCCNIPIDNISVSPEMNKLTNHPYRVKYIADNMRKRYDPTLAVLVVCPVDPNSKFDGKNVGDHKFYVVQKIKALKAFKELDKTGEFATLHKSLQHRNILCYVLKTSKPELMVYGNARENFISGQFARKTYPQDLLHYFHTLKVKDKSVDCVKVVRRMAKLCCIGVDECTALDKICNWSGQGFDAVMEVVDHFEMYRTLDLKKTGHQQRLARGEKMTIPNNLLKLMAKVPENHFLANYDRVLNSTISLKDMCEEYKEKLEVEKVYKVLAKVSGFEKIETLSDIYPGMFEYAKMKDFSGAVFDDKIQNLKGLQLQKYYEQVVNHSDEGGVEMPFSFVTIQRPEEALEKYDVANSSDMIVYLMKDWQPDIVKSMILSILGGDKGFHASLLVFANETDQVEVLSYLRSQQAQGHTSMITGLQVIQMFFGIEPKIDQLELVCNNIRFALLIGKITSAKRPLLIHYNQLSDIIKIVESVCPVQSRISFICDKDMSFVRIHNQDVDKKVTYYGFQNDVKKFKAKLESDRTSAAGNSKEDESPNVNVSKGCEESLSDSDILDVSCLDSEPSENVPSTSTTPAKTPVFHDSGVDLNHNCSSNAVKSLFGNSAGI